MLFNKKLFTYSLLSLTLLPILAHSETDADFTDSVLTVPRVVAGDTLYEGVRVQFDFSNNTFVLLNAEAQPRFSTTMVGPDEILMDHIAQRSWVNGTHACLIISQGAEHAPVDGGAHCDTLEFGGYDDWRLPNSAEISDMIINADNLDVQLNYINPSCRFMAATDGFVQTENTDAPGLIVDTAGASGTRCVRDN